MLIYSMSVSVDGFIADREGAFGWTAPNEEQFRFHIAQTRELGGYLCGWRVATAPTDDRPVRATRCASRRVQIYGRQLQSGRLGVGEDGVRDIARDGGLRHEAQEELVGTAVQGPLEAFVPYALVLPEVAA